MVGDTMQVPKIYMKKQQWSSTSHVYKTSKGLSVKSFIFVASECFPSCFVPQSILRDNGTGMYNRCSYMVSEHAQ